MNNDNAKEIIARIDEYVSTARDVKGDHFAGFVLFLVDMAQLVNVNRILSSFCMDNGAEDRVEVVQSLMHVVLTQATTRLSETLNLSEEDCNEAVTLADRIMDSLKKP